MLVLTRRLSQSIKIGDDIEITVVEVRGEQFRIGISAPKGVPVHRKEVYLQIQEENRAAANSGQPSTIGKTLDEIQRQSRTR